MIVDQNSRDKLQFRQQNNQLQNGLKQVVSAVQDQNTTSQAISQLITYIGQVNSRFESEISAKLKLLGDDFKKSDLKTEQFDSLKQLVSDMSEKMSVIAEIKDKIENGQTIVFPKETQLSGKVNVGTIDKLPDMRVSNLSDIKLPPPAKMPDFPTEMDIKSLPPVEVSNLKDLIQRMDVFQTNMAKLVATLKTDFPKSFSVDNEVKIGQFDELLDGIEELKKGFNLLINKEVATVGFPDKEIPVHVTNFKFPNPVNNVWINALNGFVETTANTVGTTLVTLPNYGQLFNRRSLLIYNNSANTIYIGGSELTTANGIPVPAGAYSPIIDAGYNMLVYAIATTNGNDIRCMEVSKTKNLDVQE